MLAGQKKAHSFLVLSKLNLLNVQQNAENTQNLLRNAKERALKEHKEHFLNLG